MLRRKTTVNERSRSVLQRILHSSSLGADENDFQKTLDNAARLLWRSRLKRLERKPMIFNAHNRQRAGSSQQKKKKRSQPQPAVADAADTQYTQQQTATSSSSSSVTSE